MTNVIFDLSGSFYFCLKQKEVFMSDQNNYLKRTLAEIVNEDLRTADVFKKFGMDFCCGGGRSLEAACAKEGLDPEEVLMALQRLQQQEEKPDDSDFKDWPLDKLVNYIVEKHHAYLEEALPMIEEYAAKVSKVHGPSHKEVLEVHDLFMALAWELRVHLKKEENILFPYLVHLAKAERGEEAWQAPTFGQAGNPIRQMLHEHDTAGDVLKKLRAITRGFYPPEYACNTWRAYYRKLEELEGDLFLHIHLENNLLFPKAVELEAKMQGA